MAKRGIKSIRNSDQRSRLVRMGVVTITIFISSMLFFYFYQNDFELGIFSRDDSYLDEIQEEVKGANDQIEPEIVYTNKLCVSDTLENSVRSHIENTVLTTLPVEHTDEENCLVHVTRGSIDSNEYDAIWEGLYVPVTRFDSSTEDISSDSLERVIRTQSFGEYPVIWSKEAEKFINAKFDTNIIQSFQDSQSVIDKLTSQKNVIGIIPIHEVTAQLKIITIDHQHPSDPNINLFTYPLADIIWLSDNSEGNSETEAITSSIAKWDTEAIFNTNGFSTFILTGHSAVGARQFYSKTNDSSYNPLGGISKLTDTTNLLHISNNNSFTDKCTQEDDSSLICGEVSTLGWLIGSGVDVVAQTGSGILDYGRPAFENTLELYRSNGIRYFGGGDDQQEARRPLYETIGNTRLAFLGYSIITPTRYLAGGNFSGNTAPDKIKNGDGIVMKEAIRSIDKNTNIKIVEMQWGDQSANITPAERIYASKALNAGADIVIGTTSHDPKGIQFKGDGVVFYGLGDFLYLEGEESIGFIIENHIYKNRYIGFNLHPVVIDKELNIQLADVDKKAEILNTVYINSSIE